MFLGHTSVFICVCKKHCRQPLFNMSNNCTIKVFYYSIHFMLIFHMFVNCIYKANTSIKFTVTKFTEINT